MNLVIISKTAGVVPTMTTLLEGQLGVNTADGTMWVNDGTRIKVMGNRTWVRDIANATTVYSVSSGDTAFETALDITGTEIMVPSISVTANPGTPYAVIEARITIDGEIQPLLIVTGNDSSSSASKFFCGLAASYITGGGVGVIQDPVIYCENSLKVEVRHVSGLASGQVGIGYTTGEYV